MNRKFNSDKMVSIKLIPSYKSEWRSWHPGRKKSFWRSELKRGFYDHPRPHPRYFISNPVQFKRVGRDVYYKDAVKISFVSGETLTIYFDSIQEAKGRMAQLTRNGNWIEN